MDWTETRSSAGEPGILRVPGWERFPWLRAGFSTRQGGRSSAYGEGEQNLGWTAGDDPAVVAANRAAFVLALTGGVALPLVTVRQVHGITVRGLDQEAEPLMTPEGKACLEGDGMISRVPGRLLATLTADCVPVLLADTRTHAVGSFHAGWRGTLGGIVSRGVELMGVRYGSRPMDLIAAIGPCIQQCCFQVGPEVRDAFVQGRPEAESLFAAQQGGTLALDLNSANHRQLLAGGLPDKNIVSMGLCTACARTSAGARMFFSHRAERGVTGRMLSGIACVDGLL